MTKDDIAEIISQRLNLSKREAVSYVECVLETLKSTLETGENIKITGFGNFVVKQKADRRGRNPQTGEDITIKARKILTFKPSAILRKSVSRKD